MTIKTKPATKEYRDNFDKIFKKKEQPVIPIIPKTNNEQK